VVAPDIRGRRTIVSALRGVAPLANLSLHALGPRLGALDSLHVAELGLVIDGVDPRNCVESFQLEERCVVRTG